MTKRPNLEDLQRAFAAYSRGRVGLLEAIGISDSNRDPLSEFSERLVAVLVGGEVAPSRVQRGWDVRGPDNRRIQVKYLTNPVKYWSNEHKIYVDAYLDDYAIVFYEALLPVAAVIFAKEWLAGVGGALAKKHNHQDTTLQLTRVNYQQLLAEPERFAALGVRIFDLRAPAVAAVTSEVS